jgi:acyl-CoA synthetase (AMP-forming)/AMP-acid ligase II
MLREAVDAQPRAEALVELAGERISYRQLWDRAARVAGGLREQGVRPGDRVAIRLPNSTDWVLAFFGGLLAGAIVVPVNTRFTAGEAGYVVTDSGSSLRFEPGEALPDGRPYAHEGARQSDVAAIFYTSGMTGFPKGPRRAAPAQSERQGTQGRAPRDGFRRPAVLGDSFTRNHCRMPYQAIAHPITSYWRPGAFPVS